MVNHSNMAKKSKNGEHKISLDVTEEQLSNVTDKIRSGELLNPSDLEVLMKKTAQKMRSYAKAKQEGREKATPIEFLSRTLGVDTSSLSSYFFTSYGVFKKDVGDKTREYVAYTTAMIHSLNLGYLLGSLKGETESKKRT